MGIRYHSYFESFFYNTLQVEVQDADARKNKRIYLNRQSTIKWLNAQLPDGEKVSHFFSDSELVAKINNLTFILEKGRAAQELAVEKLDTRVYTRSLTERNLSSFLDRIKSAVWRAFTSIANSSWGLLRARFSLQLREETIDTASQVLAVNTYNNTVRSTPAYRDFIAGDRKSKNHQVFADLPPTSKDNYIKPALKKEREVDLYQNGTIPLKAKRDTSTGTSGPSTPWYRGVKEQEVVEKMTRYAAKAVLGDRPYTFINGFAMGPWATGITATLSMNSNPQAGVAVIGPNIDEMYACIKEQARIYGKEYPIVVGGYPPHIRAVVDKAVQEGFPLHEYTVIGIVGGESMSEDLRDLIVHQRDGSGKIVRTGFLQCYSSYGASDLDINIGYESDFEIELRKLCHRPEHSALAEELFGKNEFKPMIFHYDPLNYHIESDEHRRLYYTCVRGDRISPRVRYDLGDIGKIMPVSDLLATLKKHGVRLKNPPNTNLPLLFIWGREGSQISFRGCKIAPENLGETIRRLDSSEAPNLNSRVAHYGFYQYERNGRKITEILLEMDQESDYQAVDRQLLTKLINKLAEVNTDFVAQIAACPPDERPVLRVFKKGESPMSIQQAKYPMRKKQYIFKEHDEFIPDHRPFAQTGRLIS